MTNVVQPLTLPDGSVVDLTVPEEWSQEQIISAFKQTEDYKTTYAPMFEAPVEETVDNTGQEIGQTEEEIGAGEAFFKGVGQGGTLFFQDEISAVGGGLGAWMNGGEFGEAYDRSLDRIRAENAAAAEAQPVATFAGELVGGVGTGGAGAARVLGTQAAKQAVKAGGAKKLATLAAIGAGEGTIAGAGIGERDEKLRTAGIGAATGLLFGAAGSKIEDGFKKVLEKYKGKKIPEGEFLTDVELFAKENKLQVDLDAAKQLHMELDAAAATEQAKRATQRQVARRVQSVNVDDLPPQARQAARNQQAKYPVETTPIEDVPIEYRGRVQRERDAAELATIKADIAARRQAGQPEVPAPVQKAVQVEDTGRPTVLKNKKRRGLGHLNDVIGRIERISPSMAIGVRRITQRVATQTDLDAKTAQAALGKANLKALSRKEQGDLKHALLNENFEGAKALLTKAGTYDAYKPVLSILSRIQKERAAGGQEGFVRQFFPRVVKDVDRLRKRMTRAERERFDDELITVANRLGQSESGLDAATVGQVVSAKLRGMPLGVMKDRRIAAIKRNEIDLYEDPLDSFIAYTHRHNENQEIKKFYQSLGQDVKLGSSLAPEKLNQSIARAYMNGELGAGDVSELTELLSSQLGASRIGPEKFGRVGRELLTSNTIGFNLMSTLQQVGDLAPVMSQMGVRNTIGAMLPGKKGLGAYDVGVRELSKELRTARGLSNWTRKSLKAFGFDALDKAFAGVGVRAGLRKWTTLAQKRPEKAVKELREHFGADTEQLVDDLANKRVTDDVKTLLLWDVGKIRPVGREDMPLQWQQMKNGRLAYSLMSWSLKQLNRVRNDAVQDMKGGRVFKGSKKLASLAILMGLANMPVNMVRDVVAGRDVEPAESFAEGMLSLSMGTRYAIEALNRGNDAEAAMSFIPAAGIGASTVGNLFRGVKDGDMGKVLTSTPTGRSLNNLFGNGALADLAGEMGSFVISDAGAGSVLPDPSEVDPRMPPAGGAEVPIDVIKGWENAPRIGRSEGGVWTPHESIEGGLPTLGYGHKLTETEAATGKVKVGDEKVDWREGLSDEQIDTLFRQDTAVADEAIKRLVRVPLNPNEHAALVSLVYNVGSQSFARSNALKALNKGDRETFVEKAFTKDGKGWVNITKDGERQYHPGLHQRRIKEMNLFQSPPHDNPKAREAWKEAAVADLRQLLTQEEKERRTLARLLSQEQGGFTLPSGSNRDAGSALPESSLPPEMELF